MTAITNEDLRDFIVKESASLIELDNELKTFNIFDVLRISHREIRHSNFIGWLLDPQQGHGFGDFFLLSFINKLTGISNEKSIDYNIGNLSDTQIIRETENDIDIFIKNEELSFSITIENKIRHKEDEKQLEKYYNHVSNKYQSIKDNYFVFLTPWGIKPRIKEMQDIYQIFDYTTLIGMFQNGLDKFENIDSEIRTIINQYITNVEKNVLGMGEMNKKAFEIYQKYHEVIDFIVESKPNFLKIKDRVQVFIDKHDDYEIIPNTSKKTILFYPKNEKFKQVLGYSNVNDNDYSLKIALVFTKKEIDIKFYFEPNFSNDEEVILRRNRFFNTITSFTSFSNHKAKVIKKMKPKDKESELAWILVISIVRFLKSNHTDVFEFFKERFEQIHESFFSEFIQEAKEKLTPLNG